ncbi:MAG: beta-lactamase family protein [Acidobacteria bacterium]|nr:beta-lactamase family protein [Acidobacteriota bacterium]
MRLHLIPVVALGLAAAEPSKIDPERIARIAPRMKAFADQGRVAGTVTLLAHQGKIAHFEASGLQDALSSKPMAKNSMFQIMSMTKPMVATAIMILADEGKLALVDPVEKHLPEFRGLMMVAGRDAGGSMQLAKPSRLITVRDLLTHTSGLPSQPPAGIAELPQKMDIPLAQAVLIFSQLPLQFEPGSKWLYSNNGIATLGRIIEVVSGQPFESFMAERLWKPLGMGDTFIFAPEDRHPRICAVHATRDGKLAHADPKTTLGGDALNYRRGAKYSAPEWGAYSTAQDLLAFYEMTRNWGIHNGRRILSKSAIEVMTAIHTADIQSGHMGGTSFGLAWEVVKENSGMLNYLSKGTYGHGGAFGTHGWIDRKRGLTGVYLVQGGPGATDAKYAFMRMATASVVE